MLATTLGSSSNPDKSWDEKKGSLSPIERDSPHPNVTKGAVGDKKGLGPRSSPLPCSSDNRPPSFFSPTTPSLFLFRTFLGPLRRYTAVQTTFLARTACAAAFLLVTPVLVSAQPYEMWGTRAQGMAGAFVAVADDADATWWNRRGSRRRLLQRGCRTREERGAVQRARLRPGEASEPHRLFDRLSCARFELLPP
jgi:hypothetical protein